MFVESGNYLEVLTHTGEVFVDLSVLYYDVKHNKTERHTVIFQPSWPLKGKHLFTEVGKTESAFHLCVVVTDLFHSY